MTSYFLGIPFTYFASFKLTNSPSGFQMERTMPWSLSNPFRHIKCKRPVRISFSFLLSKYCVHSSIHSCFSNVIIDFTVVFSLFLLKQYLWGEILFAFTLGNGKESSTGACCFDNHSVTELTLLGANLSW